MKDNLVTMCVLWHVLLLVIQRIDMAQDAEALKARADHFEALAQKLKSENVALERRARELRGRVDELMRHDERDRLRLQVGYRAV